MKKLFLLTVWVLFTGITSSAQSYQSMFGKDSTRWSVWRYDPTTSPPNHQMSYNNLGEDTVMYNKTYKVIKNYNNPSSTFYLHENINTGEYWYSSNLLNNGAEWKYADLSLKLGDTFRIWPNNIFFPVDSIYYDNLGRKNIRFKTSSFAEKPRFIEGLGYTWGMFLPYGIPGNDILMLCQWKDSIQTYQNPIHPNYCLVEDILGINDNVVKPEIKISPNPFSEILQIDGIRSKQFSVELYDLAGLRLPIEQITENRFKLETIAPGVYTLCIRLKDGSGIHRKIIKK